MKKIVKTSLLLTTLIVSSLFSATNENNVSKESNSTVTKKNEILKPLIVDLDKLKKKSGLRDSKAKTIKGTLWIGGGNDEVSYSADSPDGNNDEVIASGNAKVCLVGTKKSLFRPSFELSILKDGKAISSYPKTYKKRKMCISIEDIQRGDSVEVRRKGKIKVRLTIKNL